MKVWVLVKVAQDDGEPLVETRLAPTATAAVAALADLEGDTEVDPKRQDPYTFAQELSDEGRWFYAEEQELVQA